MKRHLAAALVFIFAFFSCFAIIAVVHDYQFGDLFFYAVQVLVQVLIYGLLSAVVLSVFLSQLHLSASAAFSEWVFSVLAVAIAAAFGNAIGFTLEELGYDAVAFFFAGTLPLVALCGLWTRLRIGTAERLEQMSL